jgi:hypothetical protein
MNKVCLKCGNTFPEENLRTYKMTLRQNMSSNSILRRLDEVTLCASCDASRKTTIGKFISQ